MCILQLQFVKYVVYLLERSVFLGTCVCVFVGIFERDRSVHDFVDKNVFSAYVRKCINYKTACSMFLFFLKVGCVVFGGENERFAQLASRGV